MISVKTARSKIDELCTKQHATKQDVSELRRYLAHLDAFSKDAKTRMRIANIEHRLLNSRPHLLDLNEIKSEINSLEITDGYKVRLAIGATPYLKSLDYDFVDRVMKFETRKEIVLFKALVDAERKRLDLGVTYAWDGIDIDVSVSTVQRGLYRTSKRLAKVLEEC